MEEIAIIRFQPDPDAQGHFGINNKGEIAFTIRLTTEEYRAMIYLPQPAYGVSAGVYDLGTLIVGPQQEPILTGDSYARDIGDEGFVVGQFEGTLVSEGKAFVVDLADHLSLPNRVFVYEGASGTECTVAWARAMAVSNDLDPMIVVETGREAHCVLSGCQTGVPIDCYVSGATLSSIGSSPVLDPFEVVDCRTGTRAFDIERDSSISSSPPFLAAAADIAPRTPPTCTVSGLPCDDPGIAFRGDPEFAPPLGDLGLSQDRPAAARGVNFVGYAVGYSFTEASGGANCQRQAVLWPAGSIDPTELHPLVAEFANLSRAESINRCDNLQQIVGWDPDTGNPLLWTRTSAGWEGWLLQVSPLGTVEIDCGGCEDNPVRLRQAFDVNDEGSIIAWGRDFSALEDERDRLYLLTPVDQCDRPGDVDNDGEVGFPDMALVLAAYGPCTCPWCPEDIDGDGTVGFLDLLAVLSNWGPCDGPPQGLPQSVQDCIQRVGWDPVALAACIAAIP